MSTLDGKPPEEADFANYFCTYAFLYHQVCVGLQYRVSTQQRVLNNRKTCLRTTSARELTTMR